MGAKKNLSRPKVPQFLRILANRHSKLTEIGFKKPSWPLTLSFFAAFTKKIVEKMNKTIARAKLTKS